MARTVADQQFENMNTYLTQSTGVTLDEWTSWDQSVSWNRYKIN